MQILVSFVKMIKTALLVSVEIFILFIGGRIDLTDVLQIKLSKKSKAILSVILSFAVIFVVCTALHADSAGRSSYESVFLSSYSYDARYAAYNKAFVVDVSEHQGYIDWAKVYNAGFDGAVIRAGYRGYETGSFNTDSYFETNYQNAKAAGLKVGAYFYAQPISLSDANTEADYFLSIVRGKTFELPLFVDLEFASESGYAEGRLYNANMSALGLTTVVNAYCGRIASAGYQAGLYSNYSMLTQHLYPGVISYPVWLARYAPSADYSGSYTMWQFTSKARVDGISGNCDASVLYYYIQQTEPTTVSTTYYDPLVPTDPTIPTTQPVQPIEPTTYVTPDIGQGLQAVISFASQLIKALITVLQWLIGMFRV